MEKSVKKVKLASGAIILILMVGFISVSYQIIAKNVCYDILKIKTNWFLKTIVSDDNFNEPVNANIDWQQEYPFSSKESYQQKEIVYSQKNENRTVQDNGKIYTMLEKYTTDYFPFTSSCERISKQFSRILGDTINIDVYGDSQLFLPNGHMTYERKYIPMDTEVYNISSFSSWLNKNDIDYFHVIIPSPVSPKQELETQKAGYQVYSNMMAEELIKGLVENNVDYIDLRENMLKEKASYDDYFFKYEHHMVPKAGLWAASIISNKLNKVENLTTDNQFLDIDNYTITNGLKSNGLMNDRLFVYDGKENIDLFHSKSDVNIEKYIADYNLTLNGNFDDVFYADWDFPTYNVWNHGIKALKTYRNHGIEKQGIKILLLTESYSDVITPFLACSYSEIDEIDLRLFNGSLQNYIENTKPDIVITMYSAYDLNSKGAEPIFMFN